MNITILLPSCYDEQQKLLKPERVVFPNLTLIYLAGMVPDRHNLTVIDESIQDLDFEAPIDLLAISVNTPNVTRAYEVADVFRRRGVTVVMGGVHATFLPDEALQHADTVVLGEADDSWPRLLEDFEAGTLAQTYQDPGRTSLEDLPTIKVGTPVARRPPYRSRRAELPHRAPRCCSLPH